MVQVHLGAQILQFQIFQKYDREETMGIIMSIGVALEKASAMIAYIAYGTFALINIVVLTIFWGLVILVALIIMGMIIVYYFFTPYCPKCKSRKKALLVGNNYGGQRCAKCDTYYWWIDKKPTIERPEKYRTPAIFRDDCD